MLRRLSSRECEKMCMSSEHNVPMFISLKPGTYEHTCPNCGQRTVFSVAGSMMKNKKGSLVK